MDSVYLDTNFFIYLADKSSPFYSQCFEFLKYSEKSDIAVVTSAETVQEIIHLAKNTKQLSKGIKIAQNCLKIVNELLPIDQSTITTYLEKTSTYRTSSSRDLIHLAVCLENKLAKMVTFDNDFTKFSEIKAVQPGEVLGNIY